VSGALVHLAPGPVARLTLDRPPVNVLNIAMLEELGDAITEASTDVAAKVLVLEGAGKAFCAGVDVSDHTADRVGAMIEAFSRAIAALRASPVPVIAAVHGAALGGGCELALACDIVLARDDAKLGQPEVRLGVFPPAAAALLPRLVGRQRALDLLLTGRTVLADEALRLGLVARVLPQDGFADAVHGYAASLAAHSRPVLALTKRAVVENLDRPLAEALDAADRLYLNDLMVLHDPHEGLAAFMEKRDPAWKDS
jgi:cyclohexa-1,5-dienecarbonyl-CoA hydratase